MPFVKNNTENTLRDMQQSIINIIHTVHDEVDVVMSEHLLYGISKRLAEIGSVKSIFDRIGIPYINYLFDVETNSNGSWIPNKKDEINIYREPSCEKEYEALKSLTALKPKVELAEVELDSLEIKRDVKYTINGVVLKVITPKRIFYAPRLVDKKSIEKYIKE